MHNDEPHTCDRATRYPVHDYQGIFVFYACGNACEDHKKARYNPMIFTGYNQSDVDEPIEEDW